MRNRKVKIDATVSDSTLRLLGFEIDLLVGEDRALLLGSDWAAFICAEGHLHLTIFDSNENPFAHLVFGQEERERLAVINRGQDPAAMATTSEGVH